MEIFKNIAKGIGIMISLTVSAIFMALMFGYGFFYF